MTVQAICGETVLKQAKAIAADAPELIVEELVARHASMVFRIAYSILRNHHDAEDAAQECFLRVLKARKKLIEVRNLKTWLARIAWTTALDRRRRLPSREESGAMLSALPDGGIAIDEQIVTRELQEMLEKLIAGLPKDLRETVELSTIQELNSSEIAEIMSVPESSVRTRLFRARKILREKFAAREVQSNG